MAALEKLKKEQPEVVEACNVAAGLSLGEYTALAFAGAISFEDGLQLVRIITCLDNLASLACSRLHVQSRNALLHGVRSEILCVIKLP